MALTFKDILFLAEGFSLCKIPPFLRMTQMTLSTARYSESHPRDHTITRFDHCTVTVLMAVDGPYLQLNTCKSAALHTSKRTAPQWQPPVCFTRPSRSLEKQVIHLRPSVPHWLMYLPEYAIKGL